MSHRTQKSGLLWPTRMIPRCLCPHCAPGLSASSGLPLFPASTNSSSSGTLPYLSVRFVFHHRLPTFAPGLSCTRILCGQIIPLLLSFPMGKAWARYVPNVTLLGVELNPGPFTIKEHVIITIMASVASGSAYAVSAGFSTTSFKYAHASTTFRPI
jgi:hypothetical protein